MHRTHKPIRKCHGCPFNLGSSCAMYEFPHDQWHDKAKCPGYKNEVMRKEHEMRLARMPSDHGRSRRREEMRQQQTAPHFQGNRDPRARAV